MNGVYVLWFCLAMAVANFALLPSTECYLPWLLLAVAMQYAETWRKP